MNLANISIVGPQTTKDMFKIFQLLGVSCDTLMANAAIQAQIQVLHAFVTLHLPGIA